MSNEEAVRSRKAGCLKTFFCLLALAGTAAAVLNRPVPHFQVQNLDGSAASSSNWTMSGTWVVIYIERQCGACTHLLTRLTKDKYPQLASETIVIVGGSQPNDVQALKTTLPDLANAQWYADPSRNAFSALNLHGIPVTLGIQDDTILWSVSGIPPNLTLLPSLLKKWSNH